MLRGKKILLGITGSIAAYKSIILARNLKQLGAEVQVICTESALEFVTPLTLSTITELPVFSKFVSNTETGEWANHVKLARWADLIIFAPLSANTLSKMASGQCDSLLLAIYMSAISKVVVAPAMDLEMYAHPTTIENIKRISSHGVIVLPAGEGPLASGLVGHGRMAEPEVIIEEIKKQLFIKSKLSNKRVLVTAGPTYESIDPVRFIGNHSTGKMGFAIAEEFLKRGADVTLISGPVSLSTPEGANRIRVTSAREMHRAVREVFSSCDIIVMAAAVADFSPEQVFLEKQKKGKSGLSNIKLRPTEDILSDLASLKKNQIVVGFALETQNELENARNKLRTKKLDLIVLNSLNDEGAGFGTDTNKVTFVYSDREFVSDLKSKKEIANDLANQIENLF